jgi:hypothetical protein
MMPTQHVEMLQHMWGPGPPQLALTRPILMQHDGVLQDSTAPVINAGMMAKKGGSHKHKKPVEDVAAGKLDELAQLLKNENKEA